MTNEDRELYRPEREKIRKASEEKGIRLTEIDDKIRQKNEELLYHRANADTAEFNRDMDEYETEKELARQTRARLVDLSKEYKETLAADVFTPAEVQRMIISVRTKQNWTEARTLEKVADLTKQITEAIKAGRETVIAGDHTLQYLDTLQRIAPGEDERTRHKILHNANEIAVFNRVLDKAAEIVEEVAVNTY